MVAIRILAFSALFTALLAVEVINDLVVSKAETELIVEKTKATTEFLVTLTPFGVYFLSVTVVKHIYEKIFVVKVSAKDVRKVFYKNALYFGKEMGLEHAEKVAEEVSDAAEKAFGHDMSSLDYFRTVSDTLKKCLKEQGLLNKDNVKNLIDDYANSLESAANSENATDPGAPVHALVAGTVNFLKSKGITSPKDIEFAGKEFANELRNQSGEKGDDSKEKQSVAPTGEHLELPPITGAHDDTDITDAHNAAGLMSGRMEISYLLTILFILKCTLMQKL